jgi:hypothetical protein
MVMINMPSLVRSTHAYLDPDCDCRPPAKQGGGLFPALVDMKADLIVRVVSVTARAGKMQVIHARKDCCKSKTHTVSRQRLAIF